MAEVRIDRLRKEYRGGVNALNETSLSFADGEFTCVLGPPGLEKHAPADDRRYRGSDLRRIFFDGDDVTNVTPERRDVAMVFQTYACTRRCPSATTSRSLSCCERSQRRSATSWSLMWRSSSASPTSSTAIRGPSAAVSDSASRSRGRSFASQGLPSRRAHQQPRCPPARHHPRVAHTAARKVGGDIHLRDA